MKLVLASASRARADLLMNAGVDLLIDPAGLDESALKSKLAAEAAAPSRLALRLAEAKANSVMIRHKGALVLGADQILVHDGSVMDKPRSHDEARAHLQRLRDSAHELISAAAITMDGAKLWHHVSKACLQMRNLSDEFIDSYLDQIAGAAFECVGAYQLEGMGAQLFERVDGDYFTILGLPLLEVLAFLRSRGVLPE